MTVDPIETDWRTTYWTRMRLGVDLDGSPIALFEVFDPPPTIDEMIAARRYMLVSTLSEGRDPCRP